MGSPARGSDAISAAVLARNTSFNLLGSGLPLLIAVATVPVVVRGLGPDRFGILALIWVIVGNSGVFDLGIGRATTKFASDALANDDERGLRSVLWTATTIQGCIGILGGLLLAAVAGTVAGRVLTLPAELIAESELGFRLLGLIIPAVLLTGSFRGALEAAQRFDLVNALRVPAGATNFLLPALGVLLGWGIPGIVLLLVAARWLVLGAYVLLCLRVFPGLLARVPFSWERLATLVGFGGWVAVSSVVVPLLEHLDRLMIGALLSVSAVTFYSIPFETVTRLRIIPASVVSTLFPAFIALRASSRDERVARLFARSLKALVLTLGPVLLAIMVAANWLLLLWLGPEVAGASTTILRLLAAGVLVNSLAFVPYSLLQAVGRPDLTAKFHLAELPVRLALAWGLIRLWGTTGAAMAWPLWAAIDATLLFGAVVRLGLVPQRAFLWDSLVRPIGLLLVAGAIVVLLVEFGPRGVAQGILLTFAFVAMLQVMWRYSLNEPERDALRSLAVRTIAAA